MSTDDQRFGRPGQGGRPQRGQDPVQGGSGRPSQPDRQHPQPDPRPRQSYEGEQQYPGQGYEAGRQYNAGQSNAGQSNDAGRQYNSGQGYDADQQYPPNQGYNPQPGYSPNQGYNPQPGYPPNQGYDAQPGYPPNRGYDQNQHYQQGGGGGRPPDSSARGKLIGIFVGLGLLGLLVGVGAAQFAGKNDNTPGSLGVTSSSQPDATTADQEPAATTDAPSPTPSPKPTPTKPPNYKAIGEPATNEKGLDFGFLTAVTNANGTVTVKFDRAEFYTGAEAMQHNHGQIPDDDYLIENTNPAIRTFTLSSKASIIGASRLLDDPTASARTPLTADQFVRNAQVALGSGNKKVDWVPVWLRHTNGLNGQITALAEQFLP